MSQKSTGNYTIRPFEVEHIAQLKSFSDHEIGQDYYSTEDLNKIYKLSHKGGLNASYLLFDINQNIKGIRLTYAPGNWLDSIHQKSIEDWGINPKDVAYFKTIFLAEDIKGCGWGKNLSSTSIRTLKDMNAKAIVCHSWNESPHNSSFKYLSRMGFLPIKQHKNFWGEINYECTRCGKPPCKCTATEMILKL